MLCFVLRSLQKEYCAKGMELSVCFADVQIAFDRVPKKVLELQRRRKEYLPFWLHQ